MFQLGVCSVPFRIGIEMGWSIHFDSNGSILSSGYIAILVGQRAAKFARELLDDGVFLLFFLLGQNFFVPIQQSLTIDRRLREATGGHTRWVKPSEAGRHTSTTEPLQHGR